MVKAFPGLLLVVVLLACSRTPEATYQGKTTSEWVTLSRDADPATRLSAIKALSYIGLDEKKVRQVLLATLKDSQVDIRAEAARALGKMHAPDEEIATALIPLIASGDTDIEVCPGCLWSRVSPSTHQGFDGNAARSPEPCRRTLRRNWRAGP